MMNHPGRKRTASLLLALGLLSPALQAQEPGSGEPSAAEVAKMMSNPLSYLWMFAMQNDTFWMDGSLEGAERVHLNVTTIMPVMSMQLTEGYKLVLRPWLPFVNADLPRQAGDITISDPTLPPSPGNIASIDDTSWNAGVGDMGFWAAVASNENASPPFIFGAGISASFPTASRGEYGSGRYSAGPMALAFYVGEEWTVGGILQHRWDYAGEQGRKHINQTSFQYFYYYNLTPTTKFGAAPAVSYDWTDDRYDLPFGIGFNTTVKLGKLPVNLSTALYYHTSNSDLLHNRWQLQIGITPILPSPEWSRRPIF